MIWENGIETCILSCKKRITSLCSIQDAWGSCARMIQSDDMGWEMGGGFKIGNSRTPVADSFRGEVNFLYYIRHQNKFHTDQYINIKNKCVILLKQNIGVSV